MRCFIFECFDVDLLGDDLCSNVIILRETQTHLFEKKFDLLPSIHRSVGFHLEFLENLCGFFRLALTFVDVRQFLRQPRSFVFHEDLQTRRVSLSFSLSRFGDFTLPDVTVRSVSISFSLVSRSGVFSTSS